MPTNPQPLAERLIHEAGHLWVAHEAAAELDKLQAALNNAHASLIAYLIGMLEGMGEEVPAFVLDAHNAWKEAMSEGGTP